MPGPRWASSSLPGRAEDGRDVPSPAARALPLDARVLCCRARMIVRAPTTRSVTWIFLALALASPNSSVPSLSGRSASSCSRCRRRGGPPEERRGFAMRSSPVPAPRSCSSAAVVCPPAASRPARRSSAGTRRRRRSWIAGPCLLRQPGPAGRRSASATEALEPRFFPLLYAETWGDSSASGLGRRRVPS